jgi:hypothetical protein
MRVLNVLAIIKEMPQIIEAFPILEEQFSEEIINQAETYICNLVFGPKSNYMFSEDEFSNIIMNAYSTGVSRPDGSVYYLLWSNVES